MYDERLEPLYRAVTLACDSYPNMVAVEKRKSLVQVRHLNSLPGSQHPPPYYEIQPHCELVERDPLEPPVVYPVDGYLFIEFRLGTDTYSMEDEVVAEFDTVDEVIDHLQKLLSMHQSNMGGSRH